MIIISALTFGGHSEEENQGALIRNVVLRSRSRSYSVRGKARLRMDQHGILPKPQERPHLFVLEKDPLGIVAR